MSWKRKTTTYRAAGFSDTSASGAVAGIATACGGKVVTESNKKKEPDGKMTYRVNHNTGDSVSVLGYGCMRLPTVAAPRTTPTPKSIRRLSMPRSTTLSNTASTISTRHPHIARAGRNMSWV